MSILVRPFVSIAMLLFVVVSAGAAEGGHHWSYSGSTGPAEWAHLESDFGVCGVGKMQSPIDIRDAAARRTALPAITFDYKSVPLKLIDNGHTIQVDYPPGSTITVDGKQYELLQFHFHNPSEEKINGHRFDMVAHLVHKDANGKLAVVAVLLKSGPANRLVETLWKSLPGEKGKEVEVQGVRINAMDLLPANRARYYTFTGSLTTPPCSEDVTWFVLKTPTTISKDEVARFARLYPMNARPTQALNGREVRAAE